MISLGQSGAFPGSGAAAHFDGNAFASIPDSVSDNFHGIDFLDRPLVIMQRENDPTDDTQAMTPGPGIPDATGWHYLVATYDGSTIDIYVDNVLAGTSGSTTTLPVTNVQLLIGAEDTSVGNGLVGSMDEAAIYTTALTLTQRSTHFAAAK